MLLTRFGHACVRLRTRDGTRVIDRGALTEDAAVDGADAILVTHEHFRHFLASRIRAAARGNRDLRVWTVAPVAEPLTGLDDQVRTVSHGDVFTTAGFQVSAYGAWHAPWARISELIDWVRKVSPERAVAVHDAAIHPTGMAVVGGLLGENGPGVNATYDRLEPMRPYEV
ncbi:MBL fold metallo-hydrolase [Streptomyces flaveolus]|uniref:MBL fold metallo-hydrolase n=1 Tax=Streptomyces flaveolus TaxID=67297 RepID=UPI0034458950